MLCTQTDKQFKLIVYMIVTMCVTADNAIKRRLNSLGRFGKIFMFAFIIIVFSLSVGLYARITPHPRRRTAQIEL